jgi:Mrp family chromosome partitioning ATPase
VLLVSDYIHISKVSDGVLFMVAYASTTKSQVADAINELRKNDANILGTVFTMYDRKKDREGRFNDVYYYASSDKDE